MVDNEAKARQVLEEAEKKAQGGGGFFSKLFGSESNGAAVSLFVQNDEDSAGPSNQSEREDLICHEMGCGMSFHDVASFEDHYRLAHSHQCAVCSKKFPTNFFLELHSDENHCPFFKVRREKDSSALLYKCLDQNCKEAFCSKEDRDAHSSIEHKIRDMELILEKRKMAKRMKEIEAGLESFSLARKSPTPQKIQFGDDQERVFDMPRAGNLFKSCQSWKNAGDSFLRAAEICAKEADSKHDCATHFAEAGNCYRKVNAVLAIDCYRKTCDIYTDMGRFTMAAKNHITIAELYEKELPDTEKCIEHYQKAADYYKGEEQKSSATKCLVNVAKYLAQLEQYQKAIKVFEEIAFWEADHPTLKYNAKNRFFQALLCHLCIDALNAQHALDRYENTFPAFADSREYKFVKELISSVEDNNEVNFTAQVASFDRISRLDDWHTRILLKIKKRIAADDEDDLK